MERVPGGARSFRRLQLEREQLQRLLHEPVGSRYGLCSSSEDCDAPLDCSTTTNTCDECCAGRDLPYCSIGSGAECTRSEPCTDCKFSDIVSERYVDSIDE